MSPMMRPIDAVPAKNEYVRGGTHQLCPGCRRPPSTYGLRGGPADRINAPSRYVAFRNLSFSSQLLPVLYSEIALSSLHALRSATGLYFCT
jgi:hypothetical protein